jgi:hypothetical protein
MGDIVNSFFTLTFSTLNMMFKIDDGGGVGLDDILRELNNDEKIHCCFFYEFY